VTSGGSAYVRLGEHSRSANELLVLTAARELPRIALDDALRYRTAEAMERLQGVCVAHGVR
jgi:hypothetical protein